ncbi:hypothetical protein PanWU01x14_242830 [Parasponia andersonii]|uniref:RNase H type-1 domain-containing protein n=1 Tax=Parasponia andersonii TaxID=3476 RepID=A0A2P5BFU9_PARAD|nr:hypothetical protein PanWU01x14_242830 [Parasponia andersonii]
MSCPLCSKEPESLEHLFLFCDFAQSTVANLSLGSPAYTQLYSFIQGMALMTTAYQSPLEGWVKINFDVAMGSQKMCLAVVGRDHGGSILFVVTQQLYLSSPLVGEARVALLGISEALKRNYLYAIIEGNSCLVISKLRNALYH